MAKEDADPAPSIESEIASKIRAQLKSQDVSCASLATRTGMNYQTLRWRTETGKGMKFTEVALIANALNVQPFDLIPRSMTKAGETK